MFKAERLVLDTPAPPAGPSRDLSFRLVTMLEASDLESSRFRGRAGGIVVKLFRPGQAPEKTIKNAQSELELGSPLKLLHLSPR